jgi:thiosulfate/3-mercaptopyruvate sulfurtransferase
MRSDAKQMRDDRSNPACTPAQLALWLADETDRPLVIDVRWALGAPSSYPDYLASHVPTAVWADLDADFADPPAADRRGGRHPLPDPGRLQHRLRRWGLHAADSVVTYDAADSIAASRAWWVLRWSGLRRVTVLDGGLAAWIQAGLPLAVGPSPRVPEGNVEVHPGAMESVDAAGAADLARAGRLVDARTAVRFRGEEELVDPVAGHIPGARNVPATELMSVDGRLADPAVLRERLEVAGDGAVAAYCGSGVTAAHTVWALASLGVDASLYPGSWSDWISNPTRPVATGP